MILFYIFALILIFLSYKSWRGGVEYLNYFKRELSKPESVYVPFVSVIVPCRGIDTDLEKNLNALFTQNYPNYEILFAVDSEEDSSTSIIGHLTRRHSKRVKAKLVIAGNSEREGQKIHNLREAVMHVADESKVFAFVDTDARPNADWLKNLVAPLQNEKIGAATGYRWFFSKSGDFASELRAAWNASIASALGANMKTNFCWGGSMAIRREKFQKLSMRERWRGGVSDDFLLTNALKEADLPIYFVPQNLLPSVEDCTFSELLEFTTRQMKITAVYSRNHWLAVFAGSALFILVFIASFFVIALSSIYSVGFWFAMLTLVTVSWFSYMKSKLRMQAVEMVLRENYHPQIIKQDKKQNYLWLVSPAVYLYNSLAALFSKKILWRGIEYSLDSPNRTTILQK